MNGQCTGRNTSRPWWGLCALVCLLLAAAPAHAIEGLGELLREGRLRVTTNIVQTQSPLYVTQPVIIHVEVATQGRFNGGTRIRGLQIAEAIALPPPAFAVNATRRQAGKLWAVQTWSLTLYPLKEKKYLVPSLSLEVEIVDRDGIVRRGVLQTSPQSFTAVLPPNAAGKVPWMVAENVTLTSTVTGPTEGLAQGAAIIRTFKMEVEGVPGMMLPELPSPAIPGLAVYLDAPAIKTTSNRGSLIGSRRQRTTYIVQKSGRYLLPDYTLNWWNIRTGQWAQATASAQIIQTRGVSPSAPLIQAIPGPRGTQNIIGEGLWLLVGASLVCALAALALLRRRGSPAFLRQWKLRRHVRKAVATGKTLRAIRVFYQWYDQYGAAPKAPSIRTGVRSADFETLMEKGFSNRAVKHGIIQVDGIFSEVEKLKAAERPQSKPFSLNE